MNPIVALGIDVRPVLWVFFALFWALVVLYIRLWRSSGSKELRALRSEISEAHQLLEAERRLNLTLTNRNDELKSMHSKLHGEFLELRGQFSQLQQSYGKVGELLAEVRADLRREKGLRDDQYAELMRLKAKSGDL